LIGKKHGIFLFLITYAMQACLAVFKLLLVQLAARELCGCVFKTFCLAQGHALDVPSRAFVQPSSVVWLFRSVISISLWVTEEWIGLFVVA
jgi:hypothetical protein